LTVDFNPQLCARSLALFDYWQELLTANRAIAVIRAPEMELALAMARAVAAGGIKLIEITWNSHRPEETIFRLRQQLPHCLIGAGTILDLQQLQEAISAGSQFIFCPHFEPILLTTARDRYQIPLVPGVLSPTEIVKAWQAGANTVKVFPIQAMGGANYIKSLRGPLGQVALIPTGGVTLKNAWEMLEAGAIAVGLSGDLFPRSLLDTQNWQAITDRTQIFIEQLKSKVTSN
jgi:2-dehydro-3-deoxyphosphogluconate aldolase/(4S)-4-hydroxy-2-oxoglutarate aldolase